MNHLLVGAGIPFIVAAVIYMLNRSRASVKMLVLAPLSMFLGAAWAVLPDLPRTFGLAGFDKRISMNPAIDIFFWHYTINLNESASPLFNLGFVAMLAGLFLAAWRELRRIEGSWRRN
jgi:hypothetical protein